MDIFNINLVKEFCPSCDAILIRSEEFLSVSMAYFEALMAVALKDFPSLTKDDIIPFHCSDNGTPSFRKSGVTFEAHKAKIGNLPDDLPDDYQVVPSMELNDLEDLAH